MSKKSHKELSNSQSFKNNLYAVKTCYSLSKSRVVHSALTTVLDYVEWLFYSTFFVRFVINSIQAENSFSSIFTFIMISSGILCIKKFYDKYVEQVVVPLTDTIIYRKLYDKLYQKSRNIELRCFEDAEFYSKYTMAIDGAGDRMTNTVNTFFNVIFGMIAGVVTFFNMYSIDHYAILFIIFPIIGNFVFGKRMNRMYTNRYVDGVKDQRKSDYVNRVMYLSDYAKEMRLSNVYRLMMRKFNEAVDGTVNNAEKYSKTGIPNAWLQNVLSFALIFEGIMIYAAFRTIVSKTMGLAELAILFSIMSTSSWILYRLFENMIESLKNGLFINYIRTFLNYKEAIPEDQDGIIPDTSISSIEFRDVSFRYKEDEPLISNLSFTIKGNRVVALVGHNGAGKSTIIKLLFRLYDPTEGEILVNGINIKEYNLKAYRNLFSAAFQDYKVLAVSIKENILMGRKIENEDEVVTEALRKADVLDKVKELPEGIHTILTKEFDENGAILSGGQYQKIVVARAFAKDTPIKVFDEPSSALDPIAEYRLYNSIMQDSKDKTMIFISHRLSSVVDADEVFMLENGAILERGTHYELMKQNGAYADMYTKQAKNYLAVSEEFEVPEVTAS